MMGAKNCGRKRLVCLVIAGWIMAACAGSSYINVRYQLPAASDRLKGKVVSLDFKDFRAQKNFLSETAQKDFNKFSGLFSLTLAKENTEDELLGAFDIDSLFKEAFRKRLAAMGISVAPAAAGIPVIELGIREFFLDYQSRKWITSVSYQAKLTADNGRTATESVNITAERTKTFGKSNVEKYLGEIFSECLNKLDVEKLFQQAGI